MLIDPPHDPGLDLPGQADELDVQGPAPSPAAGHHPPFHPGEGERSLVLGIDHHRNAGRYLLLDLPAQTAAADIGDCAFHRLSLPTTARDQQGEGKSGIPAQELPRLQPLDMLGMLKTEAVAGAFQELGSEVVLGVLLPLERGAQRCA